METGKSTIALALWCERLARLNPTQLGAEAFSEGVYSQEWTAGTMMLLCKMWA
jgi:hypothetical protein